jgi:hypothetical protein
MPDNSNSDFLEQQPWRSKKYARLSDDEIIDLSFKKLPDRDRAFLLKEIDHRNLNQRALSEKKSQTKNEMKSKAWWKYLPLVFALVFVLKRMFGSN